MSERRDAGFTLLELLIVLAILGAVIGVVVMRGPVRSQGLQTRAAAGAVAQAFRTARAQAIAQDRAVTVAIDPQQRLLAPAGAPPRRLAGTVALAPGTLPGPNKTGLIRFSPDGSTSGGGLILSAGAKRTEIDVEWLTGRVRIADAP